MPTRVLLTLLALTAAFLPACERKAASPEDSPPAESADLEVKARTHESQALSQAVDAYAHAQNPENDAAVRKAMADVDSELTELEDLLAKHQGRAREKIAVKFRRLEAYRSEQTTRFAEAQAGKGLLTPKPQEGRE